MAKGFKYKIDGQLVSDIDIAKKAFDHASSYDATTRDAYLKTIQSIFSNRNMKGKFETLYGPILGTVLLLLMLGVAIINPFPSSFQTGTYWVILSIGAASCAALIPGFLEVKYKNVIRATGAIAVFVIMYFMSPDIIGKVNTKNSTRQNASLYWINSDTSVVQKTVIDLDMNSRERVSEYAVNTLSSYYGKKLSDTNFTCYRKSDGKIYEKELCSELSEFEILVIPNTLLDHFNNDKRAAYIRYSK